MQAFSKLALSNIRLIVYAEACFTVNIPHHGAATHTVMFIVEKQMQGIHRCAITHGHLKSQKNEQRQLDFCFDIRERKIGKSVA